MPLWQCSDRQSSSGWPWGYGWPSRNAPGNRLATSKPTVDADVSEPHDIDDVNVVGAHGLIWLWCCCSFFSRDMQSRNARGLWYLVRLSSNHVRSLIGNMIVLYLSYDSMILGYINHGEPPQPCSQNILKSIKSNDFPEVSLWIRIHGAAIFGAWHGMAVWRLVLVNGFIGIGTGWATQGPNFDALQVWELSELVGRHKRVRLVKSIWKML